MNIVKERRRRGVVCFVCRSPDYRMVAPADGDTTEPGFVCNACGHYWQWGRDGGKYAELAVGAQESER